MTSLPTYALLAVLAAWPVVSFDHHASNQSSSPQASALATTAPADPLGDQVPPPPPPPPPPPDAAAKSSGKVVKAEAPEAPKVSAPAPRTSRTLANVDVEVSLVERGDASSAPRTVKLRVADGESGQYRQDMGKAVLNVDVRPSIIDASRTSVTLAIELINPATTPAVMEFRQMRTRMEVLMKNGEPTTVSQWSDGTLNRAIDVVVKATQIR
jgi:hypothetical protein